MTSSIRRITTIEELDSELRDSRSRPLLLFKHSLNCGVSAWALRELERALARALDIPTVVIVEVQRAREVSREIARRTGVRHESPQALLVLGSRVVWHDSHWKLETDRIAEALEAPVVLEEPAVVG